MNVNRIDKSVLLLVTSVIFFGTFIFNKILFYKLTVTDGTSHICNICKVCLHLIFLTVHTCKEVCH